MRVCWVVVFVEWLGGGCGGVSIGCCRADMSWSAWCVCVCLGDEGRRPEVRACTFVA